MHSVVKYFIMTMIIISASTSFSLFSETEDEDIKIKTRDASSAYNRSNYKFTKAVYRKLVSQNVQLSDEHWLQLIDSAFRCGDPTEKEKNMLLNLAQNGKSKFVKSVSANFIKKYDIKIMNGGSTPRLGQRASNKISLKRGVVRAEYF
ncbi:MAG: hypothetical protein HQK52_13580 [Oligoflexia bacterium]|nr:hypothetical protein [Oligoflexia bacterium]